MEWLSALFTENSVANAVLIYSLVIFLGVSLGKIGFKGVNLGIAGVLFVGIFFGHWGFAVPEEIRHFVREFGLILFVYTIGLQVGPSFFSSFRKEGITLNLLGIGLVLLGVLTTFLIYYFGKLPISVAVGLMSGAVTNTPGLGAAQQTLHDIQSNTPNFTFIPPALAYAIAYPFGVFGVILSMLFVKWIFKIDISKEVAQDQERQQQDKPKPESTSFVVENPQILGKPISILSEIMETQVVVSRILQNDEIVTPSAETLLQKGNILRIVGMKKELEKLELLIGRKSELDLNQPISIQTQKTLANRAIIITQKQVLGKTLANLQIRNRFGVNVTRIERAGLELIAMPDMPLHFGDKVRVVGTDEDIKRFAKEVGNSVKHLQHPNVVAIFIGITLGVILGSIPIYLPNIPIPLKLGLAGGPLIVAILFGKYGQIKTFSTYVSTSANLMLREIGIVLFLASVGIKAGESFWKTLSEGDGTTWILLGLLITFIPLFTIGFVARFFFKKNYLEICGLLAGSSTCPPALAFASAFTDSDKPAFTYATVFPLITFCRILVAQLLILLLI